MRHSSGSRPHPDCSALSRAASARAAPRTRHDRRAAACGCSPSRGSLFIAPAQMRHALRVLTLAVIAAGGGSRCGAGRGFDPAKTRDQHAILMQSGSAAEERPLGVGDPSRR